MKRLWKVLPPCLSDLMGFEAVINETEGLGIIDDSSRYKPLRLGRDNHSGFGHHHGRDGHRDSVMPGMRVINSDIRNEDIISGTHSKIMSAFEKGTAQLSPNFVLLAYGPSASMIGSDLEYAAEQISSIPAQSGLPASYVKIDGEKDYLYGIGCTLEAMGRLLLVPQEIIPETCNILGYNSIDWAKASIRAADELLTGSGWNILSRWGVKETTGNLKKGAAASVNLVVNESGLRLARYMEHEYGIPYVADAPFGEANVRDLLLKMKQETFQDKALPGKDSKNKDSEGEILIIGEQFMANSIRQELLRREKTNIRVLSFYDMDKACMLPGDKKLTGEDDFAVQANADTVRTIFADPDLQPLVKKDVRWIRLSNSGSLAPVEPVDPIPMVGNALDAWLDKLEL